LGSSPSSCGSCTGASCPPLSILVTSALANGPCSHPCARRPSREGAPGASTGAACFTVSSICCGQDVPGASCPASRARGPRYGTPCASGAGPARGSGFTLCCVSACAAAWGAPRRPARRFVTAKQARRPSRVARPATMGASRAPGARDLSWSTRGVCCATSSCLRPPCRTALAPDWCWRGSSSAAPVCAIGGPIGPPPVPSWTGSQSPWAGRWRSSRALLDAGLSSRQTASSSALPSPLSSSPCQGGGSSSDRWRGPATPAACVSRDYERLPSTSEALLYLTGIRLLLGPLTRGEE